MLPWVIATHKPQITSPEARPRLSGNHWINACSGGVYLRQTQPVLTYRGAATHHKRLQGRSRVCRILRVAAHIVPMPLPAKKPAPPMSSILLCSKIPTLPTIIPPPNKQPPATMDARMPAFTCHVPTTAAPTPAHAVGEIESNATGIAGENGRIPCMQNASCIGHVVSAIVQSLAAETTKPYSRVSVGESADHAHGAPMQRCAAIAGGTNAHRFVKPAEAWPVWGPSRLDDAKGAASLSASETVAGAVSCWSALPAAGGSGAVASGRNTRADGTAHRWPTGAKRSLPCARRRRWPVAPCIREDVQMWWPVAQCSDGWLLLRSRSAARSICPGCASPQLRDGWLAG